MASLQAKHSRSCAIVRARAEQKARDGKEGGASQWTSFADATKPKGCTCTPLYYSHHRHNGKVVREIVGANRKEAQRALDALRGDVARKRYRHIEDIAFDTWARRWLDGFTGKANTKRVYATTLVYARAVFGRTRVRDLTASDVRRFLDHIRAEHKRRHRRSKDKAIRESEVSPATLSKHLRQLGACLEAAVSEGYAERNPVRELHKTARPRVAKSQVSFFTDAELARLWQELVERPVYLALCKLAVLTGMRFGELAARTWADVDLLNRELHVRQTYTAGIGITPPKSGESRVVDLVPPAAALLEAWLVESGRDEGLVFEREDGGYLESRYVTRHVLYPTMQIAGIPRVGEGGRARTFHSFRASFARVALENGSEITWVQRALGHASIVLTVDLYGGWARSAQKAQAERLK